ncbi:MAG: hypothetical protein ABEJ79_11350 [Halolamina sp.]
MEIPRGDLVRSRAAADPGEVLRAVLERELTGYLVLEPGETLLFDDGARGVLTFEDGVPVLAYCEAGDRGGGAALAALATPGPCHADVFALPAAALAEAHAVDALRVGPGAPARELADDRPLAERTRAAAPVERVDGDDHDHDAVAAFLADEERVEAVREAAREEARARAAEWGLDDHLAGDGPDGADLDGAAGSDPCRSDADRSPEPDTSGGVRED